MQRVQGAYRGGRSTGGDSSLMPWPPRTGTAHLKITTAGEKIFCGTRGEMAGDTWLQKVT